MAGWRRNSLGFKREIIEHVKPGRARQSDAGNSTLRQGQEVRCPGSAVRISIANHRSEEIVLTIKRGESQWIRAGVPEIPTVVWGSTKLIVTLVSTGSQITTLPE